MGGSKWETCCWAFQLSSLPMAYWLSRKLRGAGIHSVLSLCSVHTLLPNRRALAPLRLWTILHSSSLCSNSSVTEEGDYPLMCRLLGLLQKQQNWVSILKMFHSARDGGQVGGRVQQQRGHSTFTEAVKHHMWRCEWDKHANIISQLQVTRTNERWDKEYVHVGQYGTCSNMANKNSCWWDDL